MSKPILLIILFLNSFFVLYSQKNELYSYEKGLGLENKFIFPKPVRFTKKYDYFENNYSNGYNQIFIFKNRFKRNKLFISLDAGLGILFQKQSFTFKNDLDSSIQHDVRHVIGHWQLNYGIGRSFYLNEKSALMFEFGASSFGFFRPGTPSKPKTGTFESEHTYHITPFDGTSQFETYDYNISYSKNPIYRFKYFSTFYPWLKAGYKIESGKLNYEFGLFYTFNYGVVWYSNFFVIKSNNYTAIATSESSSKALTVYFNVFF